MNLNFGIAAPFRRLFGVLPPASRRGLWLVVAVSVIAAFFETASVASILPFMAVVMDPTSTTRFPWLVDALRVLGVESTTGSVVAVGGLTVLALAMGNAVSAANLWVQTRFVSATRCELAYELFSGYMHQPYSFHVERDAASLTKVIGADVESALSGFLGSLLGVVSRGLTGVVLLGLIVLFDPAVALGSVVVLGGGYLLVYRAIRSRQNRLGVAMSEANVNLNRASIEGLGGVKELRVLGREDEPLQRFKSAVEALTRTQTSSTLTASLPRYIIEVFGFGGIVAVTLAFVIHGTAMDAVPSLALYALAAHRLVPTFQQFFAAAVTIKYHSPAVESLELDLARIRDSTSYEEREQGLPMAFDKEIRLNDLVFEYPGSNRAALDHIDLTISQNQSIGLVGRTGSGKTTLADVILGLYAPDIGEIYVDGLALTRHNVRSWRKRVGYVPQHVFLSNATIAQNIALGVSEQEIDLILVQRAAEMAQADEFIQQLPNTYQSRVGERGVRLSGGQRQRLGIARALYHDPDVLVFDEATSALDGMTEDAVMQAVGTLSKGRTMILIAHRLRTVQACDRIVMLDAGRIVAQGSYAELAANSAQFRKLAGIDRTGAKTASPDHA